MALDYSTYLHLPTLLDLQQPQSSPPEHDEMLFIIIHQTAELWFKNLLHELDGAGRNLAANDLYGAIHRFKRCRTIMKVQVSQLDILETMTPMSFTSFRDRLDTSSGFQSTQFRELEFVLGYKRQNVIKYHKPGTDAYDLMMQRLEDPSLIDHFHAFLGQQGVDLPANIRDRDYREPNQPSEQVQEGLFQLYTSRPDLAILFELMMDFDEGFQEWRYRHVKIVERTIGSKTGTGGSPGVEFLKKSLFLPVFHDLWAIRHRL